MNVSDRNSDLDELKRTYPVKFAALNSIFGHIHRGDRIFIGTGCSEPQYLVRALVDYLKANPKAFFDAEVFNVWTFDTLPSMEKRFESNFRQNTFFVRPKPGIQSTLEKRTIHRFFCPMFRICLPVRWFLLTWL